MRMQAAIMYEQGKPRPYAQSNALVVEEVNLDGPGEGEVLIEVAAAGLCHSDLSAIEGIRPRPLPIVIGHEGAGIVRECGPGVNDLKPGDHVITVFVTSLRALPLLREGAAEHLLLRQCRRAQAGTLLSGTKKISRLNGEKINHGSGLSLFAQYCVVNRRAMVKIDKSIPLEDAAIFGCAVMTGAGAVLNTAGLQAGEAIAVVGPRRRRHERAVRRRGRAGRSRSIAIDTNPEKLGLARQWGATAHLPGDRPGLRGAGARRRPMAASTPWWRRPGPSRRWRLAYAITARGGRVISAGLPASDAKFSYLHGALVSDEKALVGSYMGSLHPGAGHPALPRPVPARQAAGGSLKIGLPAAERDQRGLRPAGGGVGAAADPAAEFDVGPQSGPHARCVQRAWGPDAGRARPRAWLRAIWRGAQKRARPALRRRRRMKERAMDTPVTFPSDGLTLAGDLHVPDGATGPRPAFIVLHGFVGSKDKSHAEMMARLFEAWGYVALRFDFRGCGKSEGRRGYVLCHDQVADAKNALTWLAPAAGGRSRRASASSATASAPPSPVFAGRGRPALRRCISSCGWGHGERKFQGQHPGRRPGPKFTGKLLADNRAAQGEDRRDADGPPLRRGADAAAPAQEPLAQRADGGRRPTPRSPCSTSRRRRWCTASRPRPVLFMHGADDTVTPTEQSHPPVGDRPASRRTSC